MDKLCCFPVNDTPELSMNVKCLSTCCTDNVKAKDDVDGCKERFNEKSICCWCIQKQSPPKPQAKDEEEERNIDMEID